MCWSGDVVLLAVFLARLLGVVLLADHFLRVDSHVFPSFYLWAVTDCGTVVIYDARGGG